MTDYQDVIQSGLSATSALKPSPLPSLLSTPCSEEAWSGRQALVSCLQHSHVLNGRHQGSGVDCDPVIQTIMCSTQSSLLGEMLHFRTMYLKKDALICSFVTTSWHTTRRSTSRLWSFAICLLEHTDVLLFCCSFINHLASVKEQTLGNMDTPTEMGTN